MPEYGELSLRSNSPKMAIYNKDMKELKVYQDNEDEYTHYFSDVLNSGIYYIYLEADYNYSDIYLEGSFDSIFQEKESNDTKETANDITKFLHKSFSGSIDKENDVDYYSFTLNKPSYVYFDFYEKDIPVKAISLLNSNLEEVKSSIEWNDESYDEATEQWYEEYELNAKLPAGTYYIKIDGTKISKGQKYSINVGLNNDDYSLYVEEKETNNTKETATAVALKDMYNNEGNLIGAFNEKGDVDYYKFTIDNIYKKSTFNFIFSANEISKDSITVVDDKGNVVENIGFDEISGHFNEDDEYVVDVYQLYAYNLKAGTYYLKIEGPKDTSGTKYNIDFDVYQYATDLEEEESNDAINEAFDITKYLKAVDYSGTLKGKTDEDLKSDYYHFTLNDELTNVTFSFGDSKISPNSISLVNSKNEKVNYKINKYKVLYAELPAGDYYLKVDATESTKLESYLIYVLMYAEVPPVKAEDVKVTNIVGTDTIELKNLVIGRTYYVSWNDGKSVFVASNTEKTIKVGKLGKNKGTITIYSYDSKIADYSIETIIEYPAEAAAPTPAVLVKNIAVKNIYKSDVIISFTNLTKGVNYSVYTDQKLTKASRILNFTASGKTATFNIDGLGDAKGTLYVVAKANNKDASTATKVNYQAAQLPALAAKNIAVTNVIGNDKVVLKGLTKGFTYTIYSDAGLKKKLAYFTATGSTKTIVKQVGPKAGAIYVVVSKAGYTSCVATKVAFKAEPTPALAAKKVTITNKKKGKDTIKLTGLTKGTTYVIYSNASKKTKLATVKATKTTHSVSVNLNTKGGKVYITAQAPGYNVSATTTVSYKAAK